MNIKINFRLFLLLHGIALGTIGFAQSTEYDDLYFSSKDVRAEKQKKQETVTAHETNTPPPTFSEKEQI